MSQIIYKQNIVCRLYVILYFPNKLFFLIKDLLTNIHITLHMDVYKLKKLIHIQTNLIMLRIFVLKHVIYFLKKS